jgi:hypothetical protein
MKKLSLLFSVAVLLLFAAACKKDKVAEPPTPDPVVYPNYYNFKPGTYWVYQQYDIDTSGNATPKNVFDSCYVVKDTLINGQTYVKTYRPAPYNMLYYFDLHTLMRDSLHYVVSWTGKKIFSSEDFQSTLDTYYNILPPADTFYRMTAQMTDKNLVISTPAGSFTTSDYCRSYVFAAGYPYNPRLMHTRWAKDIGIVVETIPFFSSSPFYIERRLVRYHINY